MSKFIKLPDDVRERVENEVDILSERVPSISQTTSTRYWRHELREQKAMAWFREQELLAQIEQLKKQIR